MFIYVIVCSETLKIYIGQHKKDNLNKYFAQKWFDAHRYSGKRSHLYAALRKHPRESWSIHPLISGIENKQELDEAERLLIYALKAQHPDVGYNICDGGEGFTGTQSESAKAKMSQASKARWVALSLEEKVKISEDAHLRRMNETPEEKQQRAERLSEASYGYWRAVTPEIRQQLGETIRKALTGRTWTPEQREKIPAALRNPSADICAKRAKSSRDAWAAGAHDAQVERTRGVPRSLEVLAKWITPETRAKAAASRKGVPLSAAHRANISAAKKKWWADSKRSVNLS